MDKQGTRIRHLTSLTACMVVTRYVAIRKLFASGSPDPATFRRDHRIGRKKMRTISTDLPRETHTMKGKTLLMLAAAAVLIPLVAKHLVRSLRVVEEDEGRFDLNEYMAEMGL